jgi:hypothetical protein
VLGYPLEFARLDVDPSAFPHKPLSLDVA